LYRVDELEETLISSIKEEIRFAVTPLIKKLDDLSKELLSEMYESLEKNEVTDHEAKKCLAYIQSLIESGQINVHENAKDKINDPHIGLRAKLKIALPIQLSWLQLEVGGEIKWEDSLQRCGENLRGD